MDADGQLCALIFVILHKELDHLWILVSVGVLEPILHGYKGTTVWGESKVRKKKKKEKEEVICMILTVLEMGRGSPCP